MAIGGWPRNVQVFTDVITVAVPYLLGRAEEAHSLGSISFLR